MKNHTHDQNSHTHWITARSAATTGEQSASHTHSVATEGGSSRFTSGGGMNSGGYSSHWHTTSQQSSNHTHQFTVGSHATDGPNNPNTAAPNDNVTDGVNTANSSAASVTNTGYHTATGSDITVTVAGGDATITNPTHTHVIATTNTGSGTAHTILSPIIAVNYIIKV